MAGELVEGIQWENLWRQEFMLIERFAPHDIYNIINISYLYICIHFIFDEIENIIIFKILVKIDIQNIKKKNSY